MILTRNIAVMMLISLFGYALYSYKDAQQKELTIVENQKELEKRQLENRIKSDGLKIVADSLNNIKEQKRLSDELAATQEQLKMQMLENTRTISAKTLSINEDAKALVNQINKEKFDVLNKLKSSKLKGLGLSHNNSEVAIYFDFDKYSLNFEAKIVLDSVADYLKANPQLSLIIETPYSQSFTKGSFKQWLEQCIELSSRGDTGEGYGSINELMKNDLLNQQNRDGIAPLRGMDSEKYFKYFQDRKPLVVKDYLESKGIGGSRIGAYLTNTVFVDDLLAELEKTTEKGTLLQKWDYLKLHFY